MERWKELNHYGIHRQSDRRGLAPSPGFVRLCSVRASRRRACSSLSQPSLRGCAARKGTLPIGFQGGFSEFPLFNNSLHHSRSFTYIDDIINGLVGVLSRMSYCNGEIINIGNDKSYTTMTGVNIIQDITGKKVKFKNYPKREGDQIETKANIDKARNLLNYAPKTDLGDGLGKEIEWYLEKVYRKINLYN